MHHPQREFATEIVRKLRDAGFSAYFAGGCVRDLLLDRPAKDYDVATSARPEQVRELFGRKRTLAVGESFGVIVVLGPKAAGHVEVATFRTDLEYVDGRRPQGVVFCSPEEDAYRRDFTINGMFYDPLTSQVIDYVGGEADLAAGLVRAIRNPRERMQEDKLRMLRAVRFTAHLNFQLDPATATAVQDLSSELTVVSAERIAQELRKMLVDPQRRRAMHLAAELRLLPVILPELTLGNDAATFAASTTATALERVQAPTFEMAWAILLQELPAANIEVICRRLKLSNDELARTVWLVTHLPVLRQAPQLSLSQLKRLLAHPGHLELLRTLHALLLAEGADLHPVFFTEEFLLQTPAAEINPPPLLTGADLIGLSLTPGPRFRELLEQVRDAQLNGEIATPEAALALVHQLQASAAGGTP